MTRSWMLIGVALVLALRPVAAAAQPQPVSATTLLVTSPTATALCVGCPLVDPLTPAPNSGARLATLTIVPYLAPTVPVNKLYNVAGALYWNGATLATGSTIVGTPGTIPLFTGPAALTNSILTQTGTTVQMSGTFGVTGALFVTGDIYAGAPGAFNGSGAGLTIVPASALTGAIVTTPVLTALGGLAIGSMNLTDVVGAMTITSGFGTAPAIAGKPFAFRVTVGSGVTTSGVVGFPAGFFTAPVCVVSSDQLSQVISVNNVTATTATIQWSAAVPAGSIISGMCRHPF